MRFKKHLEIVNYKLNEIIAGVFFFKCVNNFLIGLVSWNALTIKWESPKISPCNKSSYFLVCSAQPHRVHSFYLRQANMGRHSSPLHLFYIRSAVTYAVSVVKQSKKERMKHCHILIKRICIVCIVKRYYCITYTIQVIYWLYNMPICFW